jgi:putative hydrolase of the HAD superfamily
VSAECGRSDGKSANHPVQLYRTERHRRYRLLADVDSVLTVLRDQGYALALVANRPADTQRDKLAARRLVRRFEAVLISGEVGVAKPTPDIFDTAVRRLSVPHETVWHVGDGLTNDVIGAHNANLAVGIWLNRSGAPRREGAAPSLTDEISTLHQLPGRSALPGTTIESRQSARIAQATNLGPSEPGAN